MAFCGQKSISYWKNALCDSKAQDMVNRARRRKVSLPHGARVLAAARLYGCGFRCGGRGEHTAHALSAGGEQHPRADFRGDVPCHGDWRMKANGILEETPQAR